MAKTTLPDVAISLDDAPDIPSSEHIIKYIRVNVRGTAFLLNPTVVAASVHLTSMLRLRSKGDDIKYDKDGIADYSSPIIDRDPQHFGYLVNCINDLNYIDVAKLQSIHPELVYFQFTRFLELCQMANEEEAKNKTLVPTVTSTDEKAIVVIRNEHCPYGLRTWTIQLAREWYLSLYEGECTIVLPCEIHVPPGYILYLQYHHLTIWDRHIITEGSYKFLSLRLKVQQPIYKKSITLDSGGYLLTFTAIKTCNCV